jgi:hypothetical protein
MNDDICLSCKHGGIHYCPDKNDNPIPKGNHSSPPPELPDSVNFWTYISCKKNFGLPKAAYINKCPLWQSKGK